MADEVLKGDDDDLEIVEVEQLPAQQQQQAPVENEEPEAPEDDADDQDGHDDDSDEDERLGENAEESEKEITANQRKRQKRKEYLQRVRQKKDAEIEFLRAQNADFQRRMQALEGQAHTTLTNQLDQRIGTEQARVQQAELIMARALATRCCDCCLNLNCGALPLTPWRRMAIASPGRLATYCSTRPCRPLCGGRSRESFNASNSSDPSTC